MALAALGILEPGAPADTVRLFGVAVTASLGVVIARWLFFAEAKHTVTPYY